MSLLSKISSKGYRKLRFQQGKEEEIIFRAGLLKSATPSNFSSQSVVGFKSSLGAPVACLLRPFNEVVILMFNPF
jgi:hypothetical protein